MDCENLIVCVNLISEFLSTYGRNKNATNACESFHAFFNKIFYCIHPPIGTRLAVIQKVQTDAYIK